jgi:hypothetical protein
MDEWWQDSTILALRIKQRHAPSSSFSYIIPQQSVDCVWNVMAHAQKPDFVFRRNGRVCLNRQGRQFSRLLAVEGCASAVVMLVTPCSEVVWRVLATHSIWQFPLHFPSRASPCAITFQLDSTSQLPVRQNRRVGDDDENHLYPGGNRTSFALPEFWKC